MTSTRKEQQDLVCRVTGDAPAAQMMRRYWLPALLSEELAQADGTPVRARMFGDNLVAFRDTCGRIGLLEAACPHRLASLALGRNEEGGLRCIYHGWKFAVDGTCLEMPTEPEGSTYRERMHARSYPTWEAGGIVWAYLGPPEHRPPVPAYEWTSIPRDQVALVKFLENVNYLQAAEGAIDSAHTRFLHRGTIENNEETTRNKLSVDLAPKLEVADTCYGFRYAAIRKPIVGADVRRYVKMTRYVFPTTAVTSRPMERANPALTQIFVPVDDEHTMHFSIWHSLIGERVDERAQRQHYRMVPGVDLDAHWRPIRTLDNWYQQDRAAMKQGSWTGISGLMIQDAACQETMGPITEHERERLGTSDIAIIRLRRRLAESICRFAAGEPPLGLERPVDYAQLTHVEQCAIPIDEPWQNVNAFPGEYLTEPVGAG